MTVRIYRSSDASAPVLSGTAGTLAAVFYQCLVTGYGALAGSGWAREYVSGNIAVFRAASGARMRLRLDDTSTQEARIVGYETMSDVNTGTGAFPNNGQVSGGLFVRKSATADSTARPWVLVASATGFYFLPAANNTDWTLQPGPTAADSTGQMYFGDFTSFKPGDAYNSCIICSEVGGSSTGRLGVKLVQTSGWTGSAGHYMPRPYYQIGNAVQFCIMSPQAYNGGSAIGQGSSVVFPDPISGGLLLSPLTIMENGPNTQNYARGILPGLWDTLHGNPLAGNHNDQIAGSGESLGKTFLLFNLWNASTQGRGALEISDTW